MSMNMSMNMNPNMNMNTNMNTERPMTTITIRPQGGRGGGFGQYGSFGPFGPWDGEELQPVEFCITPEFAEKLCRYAALEHVAVSVFFRRLIRTGLSRYEYQGGF